MLTLVQTIKQTTYSSLNDKLTNSPRKRNKNYYLRIEEACNQAYNASNASKSATKWASIVMIMHQVDYILRTPNAIPNAI